MSLSTYKGSKADVLEMLFPNGKWRALVADLAWDIYDAVPTDGLRIRKWGLSFAIPRFVFDRFMTLLFGARP
jgi:hypothetical protein